MPVPVTIGVMDPATPGTTPFRITKRGYNRTATAIAVGDWVTHDMTVYSPVQEPGLTIKQHDGTNQRNMGAGCAIDAIPAYNSATPYVVPNGEILVYGVHPAAKCDGTPAADTLLVLSSAGAGSAGRAMASPSPQTNRTVGVVLVAVAANVGVILVTCAGG